MSDAETPPSSSENPAPGPGAKAARKAQGNSGTREDRLKAALKANMARRKAQARARADMAPGDRPAGAANENE